MQKAIKKSKSIKKIEGYLYTPWGKIKVGPENVKVVYTPPPMTHEEFMKRVREASKGNAFDLP